MGTSSPSYPQNTSYNLSPAQQNYQSTAANWLTGQIGQEGPGYGGQMTAPLTDQQAQDIGLMGAVGEGATGATQQGLNTLGAYAGGANQYAPTGVDTLNAYASAPNPYGTLGNTSTTALNALAGAPNPYGTTGINSLNALAGAPNPYGTSGINSLNAFAQGAGVYDPFTAGLLQSTANYATNQFQQQLPAMEGMFTAAGQGPGSPMAQYLTQQNAGFATGLANTLGQEAQSAYQQGQSNQLQAAEQAANLYQAGLQNQTGAAAQAAGLYQSGIQNQLGAAQTGAGLYQQGLQNQLGAAGQSAGLYQQGLQNQLQAALGATGQGLSASQQGLGALTMPQQTQQTADVAAYQAWLQQQQNPWQAALGLPSLTSQVGSVSQPPLYGQSDLSSAVGGLSSILPFAMMLGL